MQAGLYTYAWDLEAEGYDAVAGRAAAAGFTAINLATSYHAGKFILPHNPRRRVYFAEDGSLYFQPDLSKYGRIQPRVNSLVSAEGDPVAQLVAAARTHGLGYVAWTVVLHNSWIGERFPDTAMHTAFGDPLIHSLSPAHPDVRNYAVTMVRDLVNRYDVSAIELESPGYMGFLHGYHHEIIGVDLDDVQQELLAISFNPVEVSGATADGIDVEGLRRRVVTLLDRAWNEGVALRDADGPTAEVAALLDDPDLAAYRAWTHAQVVSLAVTIRETVREVSSRTHIRHFASRNLAEPGAEEERTLLATGDAVLLGYLDNDREAAPRVDAARALNKPLWGMVRALHPDHDNLESVRARIAALRSAGVDGIDVYNYGLMTRRTFDSVASALRA